MQDSLLLRGVTLPAGKPADVLVNGETIAAVTAPGGGPPAAQQVDLDGYLLLPAPAEPHAHLDTALTAGRVANPTGDLAGAILAWLAYRPTVERGDVVRRATEAALLLLGNGATAIRSHVGVEEGFPAELLAIRARSVQEAVAAASPERVVVHRGRVVCRTTLTRETPALPETPAPPEPPAVPEPPAAATVRSAATVGDGSLP